MMSQPHEGSARQERVRADQMTRSLPLLVLGALLVNYGVNGFNDRPVEWQYGAPLAFVIIWAVLKLDESRTGFGPGRVDYLAAGAFVFMATELVMLRPFTEWLKSYGRVQGIWTVIVALGLFAIARVAKDAILAVAALVVVAAGIYAMVEGANDLSSVPMGGIFRSQPNHAAVIGYTGAVLVLAGLWAYRAERSRA
jgi:hypothetical protein